MRFLLESTNWYKTEDIIKRYPFLNQFGFEKITVQRPIGGFAPDENGKHIWQVIRLEPQEKQCIYVYNLEELIELMKSSKTELVIGYEEDFKEYYIEIYDGYRE